MNDDAIAELRSKADALLKGYLEAYKSFTEWENERRRLDREVALAARAWDHAHQDYLRAAETRFIESK